MRELNISYQETIDSINAKTEESLNNANQSADEKLAERMLALEKERKELEEKIQEYTEQ
ncbi:MAG: hypothetical protein LBQ24_02690 [Candidatus Peribacteria bacterium]|jgi:hypothetical protein|nr:hypothetical protein [Candidatus Peribacteria bacterium]